LHRDDRDLLHAMPVFGGVSDDALEFLMRLVDVRSVAPGYYFFHEGEDAVSMFVIQDGQAAVLKSMQGGELEIDRLNQGDCFGEMALLDLYPRSCSIKALSPCRIIEIGQSALFKLYEYNLEQFTIIQMNIGREISRRLRLSGEKLFQARQEQR